MTARIRRLISDYEQVQKKFIDHKNIIVQPISGDPPERYRVTYYVNGIYLHEDGRIETLGKHIVEITLHSEYPRYKPICRIVTPIWHPNFRDGQICIGDIWGAGESLSDIIVNIGDMIQYKSWNSYSPLSADAAKWAMENKNLFPVGTIDLYKGESEEKKPEFEIDIFGADNNPTIKENIQNISATDETIKESTQIFEKSISLDNNPTINETEQAISITDESLEKLPKLLEKPFTSSNDFEITADELAGIEFIPTSNRMQNVSHGETVKGGGINFKTIFMKGILYGLIGGIVGWILGEIVNIQPEKVLEWMGYSSLSSLANMPEVEALSIIKSAVRINSAITFSILGCTMGAFMGLGEGIYYGSKDNTAKYTFLGLGIGTGLGAISGYIGQVMYTALLKDNASTFSSAFVRAMGWAILGLGIGLSIGLIKPDKKRVLYCCIGGLIGGFLGGFIFNFVASAVNLGETDTGTVPRAIGYIIMGILIGLGIGLLEQFAKSAWLKVIRGEFEGKEYLVFSGTTSIGNSGKNTIVLFKDKLVAPSHCDIILEGNKYVLIDKGSPMGTIINGMRVNKHILKQGDIIAIGNSVLVFNVK